MTAPICGALVVLLSVPGTAVLFALLGDRLNLALSVLVGVAAASATAKADIPYLAAEFHSLVALFAFVAAWQVAMVVSFGLAGLVAPALGIASWATGAPDGPPSELLDLTGS